MIIEPKLSFFFINSRETIRARACIVIERRASTRTYMFLTTISGLPSAGARDDKKAGQFSFDNDFNCNRKSYLRFLLS